MTSTNDGKDVKSNQSRGQKGKSYYIELYKSLDAGLSSDCDLKSRTQHLCEAWRRVHSLCLHALPDTHVHLLSWLQRHTARTILQTEWQQPKSKDAQTQLDEAIDAFIAECNSSVARKDGVSPPWEHQLQQRGEWFKRILGNPWGHPVLRALLDSQGPKPGDDEILEWLKEERGVMFVTRLRQLAASKCDDLAMALVTAVMDRVRATTTVVPDNEQANEPKDKPVTSSDRPTFADILKTEAGFTVDVWELITDIEFVLLHKGDRRSKCIDLAKQTPLRLGYLIVDRLQSRLECSPREKKLWKNAKDVATLIAQVIITRCMVIPVCAHITQTALICCTRSLVRLLPAAKLPAATAALAAPAATARHLHTLAHAVNVQLQQSKCTDMNPFVCELYVRAITAGMNELERHKMKTEKESEAVVLEQTLSAWFMQLGALLAGSPRVQGECALTAFSVHPARDMYDRIRAAPPLPPVAGQDDPNTKQEPTSEFGSWTTDSRTHSNLVKTSETLNIKHTQNQANVMSTAILTEGEAIGLSPDLCQDLAVLLSGPRVKTLSWDMDRETLLENCRTYMERTHGGTRSLTTELKYLNLDPASYMHLPEEEEEENNLYYGIEKGYEHLVELPEDVWQDSLGELTESACSSSIDIEAVTARRKKKVKRLSVSSEEDYNPLSVIAEVKRTEKKKERPHSKERSNRQTSKERKNNTKSKEYSENKEGSRERRKDNPEDKGKKKEKKPRKKKTKQPFEPKPGSLSSLIGMKVAKIKIPESKYKKSTDSKTPICITDSDYDSQGKSSLASLNSEGNDPDVLFDGLFSMEDYKSPENDPLADENTLSNSELCVANGKVAINTTKKPVVEKVRPRMCYVKNSQPKPPPVLNNMSAPSQEQKIKNVNTVREEVKKSITKLIEFRRQKSLFEAQRNSTSSAGSALSSPRVNPDASPIQSYKSPNAIRRQEFPDTLVASPKPLAVPEIPKLYINKAQSEHIKDIKQEVDMLLSAKYPHRPVIQYANKTNLPQPMNYADAYVQSVMQQDRQGQIQHQPSSKYPLPVKTDNVMQKTFQNFLKELQESINAGTGANKSADASSTAKTQHQHKKEIRPTSRVTPVIPKGMKSEPGTSSQCAKPIMQAAKKVDNQLNTFSRLSYMHKTKQSDMKLNRTTADTYSNYHSQLLNKAIEDQQMAKMKLLQMNKEVQIKEVSRVGQTPQNLSIKDEPKVIIRKVEKQPTSAVKSHPMLTNILKTDATHGAITKHENQVRASPHQMDQLTTQLPRSMTPASRSMTPAPTTKESALSEKDQIDLLLLLRQQNKLNSPVNYVNTDINNTTNNILYPNPNSTSSNITPTYQTASANRNVIKNHVAEIKNNHTQKYESCIDKVTIEPVYNKSIESKSVTNSKSCTSKKKHEKSKVGIVPPNSNSGTNSSGSKNVATKKASQDQGSNPQEWQSVMDAILKHKTPSRGPNALDMALKKDSFMNSSLRNQRIKRSNVVVDSQNSSDDSKPQKVIIAKHVMPAVIQKKMNPVPLAAAEASLNKDNLTSIQTLVINPPKNPGQNPIQQTKNETPATDQLKRQVEVPNKPSASEMVKEKEIGIPNSDYDLLDELMDDELRQEIGELSSDEETYRSPTVSDTQGSKSVSTSKYANYVKSATTQEKFQAVELRCSLKPAQESRNIIQTVQQPVKKNNEPKPVVDSRTHQVSASENLKPVIIDQKIISPSTTHPRPTNVIQQTNVTVANKSDEQIQAYNICQNMNRSHINVVDPRNVIITAVPQPVIPNVVLVGSDLVYDPFATVQAQLQAGICNVSQTPFVINATPNIAVYHTPRFATPIVNEVIIGNAMTVPITADEIENATSLAQNVTSTLCSITSTHCNVTVNPCDQSQLTSAIIASTQNAGKPTDVIHEDPQNLLDNEQLNINKAHIEVEPHYPVVKHLSQELDSAVDLKANLDINSNKNCERKVLSEVQERQTSKLIEKIELNITLNQKIPESDKEEKIHDDLENVKEIKVQIDNIPKRNLKEQERLKKKRLAILNRVVSHRSCATAIPLEYVPLIKQIQKNLTITAAPHMEASILDVNSASSNLTLNNSEIVNDQIDVDNSKENEGEPSSCRRILLRSSNELKAVTVSNPQDERNPVGRKTKVRLKKIEAKQTVNDNPQKSTQSNVIEKSNEDKDSPKRVSKRILEKRTDGKYKELDTELIVSQSKEIKSKKVSNKKQKIVTTVTKSVEGIEDSPVDDTDAKKTIEVQNENKTTDLDVHKTIEKKSTLTRNTSDLGVFDIEEALQACKIPTSSLCPHGKKFSKPINGGQKQKVGNKVLTKISKTKITAPNIPIQDSSIISNIIIPTSSMTENNGAENKCGNKNNTSIIPAIQTPEDTPIIGDSNPSNETVIKEAYNNLEQETLTLSNMPDALSLSKNKSSSKSESTIFEDKDTLTLPIPKKTNKSMQAVINNSKGTKESENTTPILVANKDNKMTNNVTDPTTKAAVNNPMVLETSEAIQNMVVNDKYCAPKKSNTGKVIKSYNSEEFHKITPIHRGPVIISDVKSTLKDSDETIKVNTENVSKKDATTRTTRLTSKDNANSKLNKPELINQTILPEALKVTNDKQVSCNATNNESNELVQQKVHNNLNVGKTASKNGVGSQNNKSEIESLKDKIGIEELPLISGDPNKKCVRIKLPNGKTFKATVYGKMHVSYESLFSNPTMRSALLENMTDTKRYTVNIKQVSTAPKNDPTKIVETRIEEVNIKSNSVIETVDLLSDDEDEIPNQNKPEDTIKSLTQSFKTEFGVFKISSLDLNAFNQHQQKLQQKTFIKLIDITLHSNKQLLSNNAKQTVTKTNEVINVKQNLHPPSVLTSGVNETHKSTTHMKVSNKTSQNENTLLNSVPSVQPAPPQRKLPDDVIEIDDSSNDSVDIPKTEANKTLMCAELALTDEIRDAFSIPPVKPEEDCGVNIPAVNLDEDIMIKPEEDINELKNLLLKDLGVDVEMPKQVDSDISPILKEKVALLKDFGLDLESSENLEISKQDNCDFVSNCKSTDNNEIMNEINLLQKDFGADIDNSDLPKQNDCTADLESNCNTNKTTVMMRECYVKLLNCDSLAEKYEMKKIMNQKCTVDLIRCDDSIFTTQNDSQVNEDVLEPSDDFIEIDTVTSETRLNRSGSFSLLDELTLNENDKFDNPIILPENEYDRSSPVMEVFDMISCLRKPLQAEEKYLSVMEAFDIIASLNRTTPTKREVSENVQYFCDWYTTKYDIHICSKKEILETKSKINDIPLFYESTFNSFKDCNAVPALKTLTAKVFQDHDILSMFIPYLKLSTDQMESPSHKLKRKIPNSEFLSVANKQWKVVVDVQTKTNNIDDDSKLETAKENTVSPTKQLSDLIDAPSIALHASEDFEIKNREIKSSDFENKADTTTQSDNLSNQRVNSLISVNQVEEDISILSEEPSEDLNSSYDQVEIADVHIDEIIEARKLDDEDTIANERNSGHVSGERTDLSKPHTILTESQKPIVGDNLEENIQSGDKVILETTLHINKCNKMELEHKPNKDEKQASEGEKQAGTESAYSEVTDSEKYLEITKTNIFEPLKSLEKNSEHSCPDDRENIPNTTVDVTFEFPSGSYEVESINSQEIEESNIKGIDSRIDVHLQKSKCAISGTVENTDEIKSIIETQKESNRMASDYGCATNVESKNCDKDVSECIVTTDDDVVTKVMVITSDCVENNNQNKTESRTSHLSSDSLARSDLMHDGKHCAGDGAINRTENKTDDQNDELLLKSATEDLENSNDSESILKVEDFTVIKGILSNELYDQNINHNMMDKITVTENHIKDDTKCFVDASEDIRDVNEQTSKMCTNDTKCYENKMLYPEEQENSAIRTKHQGIELLTVIEVDSNYDSTLDSSLDSCQETRTEYLSLGAEEVQEESVIDSNHEIENCTDKLTRDYVNKENKHTENKQRENSESALLETEDVPLNSKENTTQPISPVRDHEYPVKDMKASKESENLEISEPNAVVTCTNKIVNSELILNGIEYEDPVEGTCYVFPIVESASSSFENDDFFEETEEIIQVIQEYGEDGTVDSVTLETKEITSEDYLTLKMPQRTYSSYKSARFSRNKRTLKRKIDMSDIRISEKKYRKGKNIDYPKITVTAMMESSYSKEFKRVIDYCTTLKFSYSQPFHKDYIDMDENIKNWPLCETTLCYDFPAESDADILFCDLDNIEQSQIFNPLDLSLADEISAKFSESEPSRNDAETNFNMGFGEGSDRVIQNLEDVGDDLKFSAATLSDVKQPQPFLLPEDKDYFKTNHIEVGDNTREAHIKHLKRYFTYIQMRDKVRSFFKKTSAEFKYEWTKPEKEQSVKYDLLNFPFDLYNTTDFLEPSPTNVVVQVVQVGQLPVSAAAQNPVTCDPRVTQVSDASPSQCSVDNSPQDDSQPTIKTEYTELTTADLSVPLMQEYGQHHQTLPMESHVQSNMSMTDENIPIETEIKSVVKIELMEEPEEKEENHDGYDNYESFESKHMNNIEYSFDGNSSSVTPTLESEPDYQAIYNAEKQNVAESYSATQQDQKQNGASEKTDQIAHAMNAAGITTASETLTNSSRAHALVNILSQKLRQGSVATSQTATNSYSKTTAINAMALQQALAQILPPPLNQTNTTENNQQAQNNQVGPQVLHIVQGKNASGNQVTLVDNSQQSVINTPNATPVLHIVQNKSGSATATSNGSTPAQTNSFGGLSLVDAGLQQGGNQLLHIVNTGSQKNSNAAGQLLKRVNLLTNLTNVQGSNEQKMVQFVCKSADGKSIQLNAPHQRSMVLRLQPIETPSKSAESQDLSPTSNATNSASGKDNASQQEIKSRSVYEENYAKFIQNSSNKSGSEKSTSLPKFNQAFGKPVFQEGNQNHNEVNSNNSHLSVNTKIEPGECQATDNAINLDHIGRIGSPPMLIRKPTFASQSQANLVQQLKQSITPMNIQTMHGGVIYTRQIPVNIGGGQTINLITVPSTELVDDSSQKQQSVGGQNDIEPSIIKIVPHNQAAPNTEISTEDGNASMNVSNETNQNPQPQPVLTQMRIKLPMLSKAPQMVSGARVVRPSFFQIQRNVIGGTNQPVYQQLVLTAAPPLGQQTIRLPQTSRQIKVPTDNHSAESHMSSSTLEQLREFDMVLEQVKERSSVPPNASSSTSFPKLHTPSSDTTDGSSASSTSTTETTQQVLYSIGNNHPPLNVAYINRKATVTAPTTSSFVRSPDSSGIVDSPTSSTHVQIPHRVRTDSTQNDPPSQPKPKVSTKSKSRPKASSNPPNTLKLNTVPPKTSAQKPMEDEQTTQRILYILAEYKEQVENSPDKDKPAPRRRSNPPSNPSGSSKRKKSSSGSRRCGRDMSPIHGEDTCRTMGSEDSSCGTSQGDCNESCLDSHSPQDSPRKVVRKLTFEQESPAPTPRPQPQRNVIVADGQTITVARGTAGKPATAVLMPANYILPVSMVKGGQQIAIVTNRGPKLLTVGGGEGGATNALLLQRLIGPAGLKPVLARPGVRHVRLPTAALHNLQAFNLATATTIHPPDSTASSASAPTPPELIDTRATSSPWTDRDLDVKPERGSSPEGSEPWHLPSSGDPHDYSYEETVRADNLDRTVLDPIPDRYSPDMEAQRIFDKMFDVESKKSYMGDSPRCAYDIDASDCDDKPYHQVVQKKDGSSHRQHRFTHVSAAALRHKYAILEHELRLQKSLSEECEDLGVDSPSASELFPEAELLFATSPAHEHTQDQGHHSHTPQPTLMNQSCIPQPDMDDQIATDHLLTRSDMHDSQQDLNLGLEDVGIVTVSEDGMQATIALDQEEFARAHPNTTFHSEPEEGEVQPFTIAGLKGRHITSTIFHSHRAPATVLMTAPQTTVISQATADHNQPSTVKYSDIDNMINSLPSTNGNNINLSSVLVKDEGLTRFDSILNEHTRELHLSNTASAIVHSAGNATQVIRRVCYDDDKRDSRFLMDEPDALIAGDDAKMIAEDSSRDATLESIAGDVDDDRSSPERHAELFWESNSASERSESRRPLDFSSDSEKCCKSPSYDETNSTDSSGAGTHMRLDSVIKQARGLERSLERSGSGDGSSASDAPPLRTYPPQRAYERSLSGKTRAGERGPDCERRRRRGVPKRGCHCCGGDPDPPRPKKPRQKKPAMDFACN